MKNTTKKDKNTQVQPQAAIKYPELSDSELEVVCGGGNIFRRRGSSSSLSSGGVKA